MMEKKTKRLTPNNPQQPTTMLTKKPPQSNPEYMDYEVKKEERENKEKNEGEEAKKEKENKEDKGEEKEAKEEKTKREEVILDREKLKKRQIDFLLDFGGERLVELARFSSCFHLIVDTLYYLSFDQGTFCSFHYF